MHKNGTSPPSPSILEKQYFVWKQKQIKPNKTLAAELDITFPMIIRRRNVATSKSTSMENWNVCCTSQSQPQTEITAARSHIPHTFCIVCLTIACAEVFLWWSNYFTTILADLTSHQRPDLPTTYESYSFGPLIIGNLTRKKWNAFTNNENHNTNYRAKFVLMLLLQQINENVCVCW